MPDNKEPTWEQISKLLEWSGFTDVMTGRLTRKMQGMFNGELIHIPAIYSLEFLGFLFKYAVPKTIETMQQKWHKRSGDYLTENGARSDLFSSWNLRIATGISESNALFWAIWTVIPISPVKEEK